MRSALTQEESTHYEPLAINFHLGKTSPREPLIRGERDAPRLLRLLVGIDHLARGIFGRRQHNLGRDVPELSNVVAFDVLELDLQYARLRPFAVLTELHVADHGFERVGTKVVRNLVIFEAFGPKISLPKDLNLPLAQG